MADQNIQIPASMIDQIESVELDELSNDQIVRLGASFACLIKQEQRRRASDARFEIWKEQQMGLAL